MADKKFTPQYHARVLKGWSNDPNGLIWYDNKAHLFFQHYPHKAEWGTMHWGHFTTEDFVHWNEEDIALIPDEEYEDICGCCSGNAIEIDGKLYLMYTAAQPDRQRQCLAVAEDGVHFKKDENNPVLVAEDLSEEVCTRDFRDPKIFKKDGWYYCLAGTRIIDKDNPIYVADIPNEAADTDAHEVTYSTPAHTDVHTDTYIGHEAVSGSHNLVHGRQRIFISGGENVNTSEEVLGGEVVVSGYGNIILFKSKDLRKWEYCGKLIYDEGFDSAFYELDGVYECPDLVEIDGHELIFASPQNLPQLDDEYENIHSTLYLDGRLDLDSGRFTTEQIIEIDGGFDFYAPQVVITPDGRRVMIAWKEMWDRTYPTRDEGWAGTYTLPRELSYRKGRMYQSPVRELYDYRANEIKREHIPLKNESITLDDISGSCMEIDAEFDKGNAGRVGIKVFCGGEHETVIAYDTKKHEVIFDRTHSGERIRGKEGNLYVRTTVIDEEDTLRLKLFLDHSSVEVFINDGRYVMTGNVYPDVTDTQVAVFSSFGEAELISLVKYDIEV